MVFPIVMYECESWTVKKTEHQRIDSFELCWWGRLLRVPWTARRWNQSTLKEISPEYSLKDWCWIPVVWIPDVKRQLIGKDSDTGKDWRQEEKGMTKDEVVEWQHWLNGYELSKLWEMVKDREAWCAVVHGITKRQTLVSNWIAKWYLAHSNTYF